MSPDTGLITVELPLARRMATPPSTRTSRRRGRDAVPVDVHDYTYGGWWLRRPFFSPRATAAVYTPSPRPLATSSVAAPPAAWTTTTTPMVAQWSQLPPARSCPPGPCTYAAGDRLPLTCSRVDRSRSCQHLINMFICFLVSWMC